MSGNAPEQKQAPGLPLWMATFADLMALMMTFFVLLFAFSEVEQEKFKQMAGSMATAFGGVQYIKSNSEDNTVGMEAGIMSQTGFSPMPFGPTPGRMNNQQLQADAAKESKNDELMKELKEAMAEDIAKGDLILERDNEDIVVRFPEHVSFASGSANLVAQAPPLIARVLSHIRDHQMIIVAGHTDNRPLAGGIYKSNWDLSAARSASVAEQILSKGEIEPNRIIVAGYADTRPVAPNDTAANRTLNRRVEIIVKHINDDESPASTHSHVFVD